MRAYVKRNRQQINELSKQRNRLPEINAKKRLIQKRYRESHRAFLAAAARVRRAGLKAGSFTEKEWISLKEQHGNKCLCCKRSEPDVILEADHVVALADGGEHCMGNIQPLCRSCNAAKGKKNIDYRT
jgi:5-methylcytosine-specific restriction endonuclease McrA